LKNTGVFKQHEIQSCSNSTEPGRGITAGKARRVEQHSLGKEENGMQNLCHSNFLWCSLSKVFPLSG